MKKVLMAVVLSAAGCGAAAAQELGSMRAGDVARFAASVPQVPAVPVAGAKSSEFANIEEIGSRLNSLKSGNCRVTAKLVKNSMTGNPMLSVRLENRRTGEEAAFSSLNYYFPLAAGERDSVYSSWNAGLFLRITSMQNSLSALKLHDELGIAHDASGRVQAVGFKSVREVRGAFGIKREVEREFECREDGRSAAAADRAEARVKALAGERFFGKDASYRVGEMEDDGAIYGEALVWHSSRGWVVAKKYELSGIPDSPQAIKSAEQYTAEMFRADVSVGVRKIAEGVCGGEGPAYIAEVSAKGMGVVKIYGIGESELPLGAAELMAGDECRE